MGVVKLHIKHDTAKVFRSFRTMMAGNAQSKSERERMKLPDKI